MALYISIAVLLFVFAGLRLSGSLDRRYEMLIVSLLTILAFVLSFTRWRTGTDWDSYIETYTRMVDFRTMLDQRWWGPGYSLIAIGLNKARASYSTFLFVVSLILFSVKYRMLCRTCAAPLVAVFVLFCTDFYGIYFVRESVAVVFFWAFTYAYFERRYILAFSSAACAVAFHYSAALPIMVLLLITNLKWRRVLILGPLVLLAAYLFVAGSYMSAIGAATDVGAYVGTGFVEEKASVLSTTVRDYLKIAFWLFVAAAYYCFFWKRPILESGAGYDRFCIKIAVVILMVTVALLPVSEIFARLPEYALPLFAVGLSNYDFQIKKLDVGGAVYIAALFLLFAELYFLFSGYAKFYYPVRTIFG